MHNTNPDDYLFEEILRRDQELYSLATYDIAQGMIMVMNSPEESMKMRKRVAGKYNYFKKLIQSGECTFDFIRKTVLMNNGPVKQDLTMDQYIEDLIEESDPPHFIEAAQTDIQRLQDHAKSTPSSREVSQAEAALATMFFDSLMKAIEAKRNHPYPTSDENKDNDEKDTENEDNPFGYDDDDNIPF